MPLQSQKYFYTFQTFKTLKNIFETFISNIHKLGVALCWFPRNKIKCEKQAQTVHIPW
jgi:hypothetical protein